MPPDNTEPANPPNPRAHTLFAGVFFAAIFVLTAWFPPAVRSWDPNATGTLARMFPGVSPLWVGLRLGSLLVAVLAIVAWIRDRQSPRVKPATNTTAPASSPHSRALLVAAVTSAIAQLACAPFADRLGSIAQLVYVCWLFVPAALFATDAAIATQRLQQKKTPSFAIAFAAVLIVVGAWALLRMPPIRPDPRAASVVDCWLCWGTLESASPDSFNILTDGPLPGLTSMHLVFDGAGVFGRLIGPATIRAVFVLHVAWLCLGALALGAATRRRFGPDAGAVAAAVLLFSPYVLAAPLNPCAIHFGAATAGVLLWLYVRATDDGATWAMAGLGACGGIAATHPAVAPMSALLLTSAAFFGIRRSHRIPAALVAGACSFAAATVPAIPTATELQGMLERYVGWSQNWSGIEQVLLGQRSVFDVPAYWGVSAPSWEIVTAAIVAPFHTARTPLRLWGDTLFDPLGALLAAIGLGIAATALVRRRANSATTSPLPLALVSAAILPAFVTSFDRPSLVRMLCLPTAMGWTAAVAYATLLSAWSERRSLDPGAQAYRLRPSTRITIAAVVVLAIATGGTAIFDYVNPSILPASSTALAIETSRGGGSQGFLLLEHDGHSEGDDQTRLDWMFVEESARVLAPDTLRTRPISAGEDLRLEGQVVLWSPGLEMDRTILDSICSQSPDAALFEIHDRSGTSTLLAAAPADSGWTPALPAPRWARRPCPS